MDKFFVRVAVLCGLFNAGTLAVAEAQTPNADKYRPDLNLLHQQLSKFAIRQEPVPAEDPIPRDIRARANALYPFVSQQDERTKYIVEEMRAAADRERGNSYSIRTSR